jgi:DNA-directed RNA polymerase specialized sigma24 family protein
VSTSKQPAAVAEGEPVPRRAVAPEVLEEFHRRLFRPLARRAVFRHGLSEEDARDIVQDAFVLAVVKLDANGNPESWFIGVVDRLAIGLLRKTGRRAALAMRWGLQAERKQTPADEDGGEDL